MAARTSCNCAHIAPVADGEMTRAFTRVSTLAFWMDSIVRRSVAGRAASWLKKSNDSTSANGARSGRYSVALDGTVGGALTNADSTSRPPNDTTMAMEI